MERGKQYTQELPVAHEGTPSQSDGARLREEARVIDDGREGYLLEDLRFRFLDPRRCRTEDAESLVEAYACWSRVWRTTLLELDGHETLFSDDFTRQDEVGVLFVKERAAAMACLRWLDFSLPLAREDSYFRVWPQEALDQLIARGKRVLAASYLTVAPEWRGASRRLPALQIITELTLCRFLESGADAFAGQMRNDRKLNQLAYRYGARRLCTTQMHGVSVDLIAAHPDEIDFGSSSPEQRACTETLWNQAWTEYGHQSSVS